MAACYYNLFKTLIMEEFTKVILNPEFIQTIETQYHFEAMEKFMVKVFDADDKVHQSDFSQHDFIGYTEFTLHEIVTARDSMATRTLVNSAKSGSRGSIIISSEEIK